MKVERPRARLSRRADAREDAVDHRQRGRFGRHERTHLRQDRDQRRLPQVGGLAAHVRAGDDGDQVGGIVQVQIVGDEAPRLLLRQPLDHRMPARQDAHLAGVGECGPLVAILRRHLRQRRGHIQFRHRRGRGADALRVRRRLLAHRREELLLQREDLLLGVQHLALVVLQLRRGEALGVDQRLLAFVIGGRQVLVGAS